MFNRKYIFKGSIFHCYVSLPECILLGFMWKTVDRRQRDMWMSNGKALLKTPMAKVIQPYEAWCQIEGDKWLEKEQVVSEGLFQKNALGISEMSDHFWRRFQWLDRFWWVFNPFMNYTWTHQLSCSLMLSTLNFGILKSGAPAKSSFSSRCCRSPYVFKTKRCSVWILHKAWSNDCKPTTLWR